MEFIIKIYSIRKGITQKMGQVQTGEELLLHEVFGSITYQGRGQFIASCTGINPFLLIFRQLHSELKVTKKQPVVCKQYGRGSHLPAELENMLGSQFINLVEHRSDPGFPGKGISREIIQE